MSAKIIQLPLPPRRGYSLWHSIDMDGRLVWFVTYADADGIIHDEWAFSERTDAQNLYDRKTRGAS